MRKAFTLAEILITLGIIGIVSAMTLPTLQANITNKQFRTKFLKNYSQIQQVMKKMEADDIPLTATGNKNEPFYKNFRKYLSNTVDCRYNSTLPSECFDLSEDKHYNLSGNTTISNCYFDDGQIALADGTILLFENPYGSDNPPIWIFIDLNGKKQPNKLGWDLFCFHMTDDGLKAMGLAGTTFPEEQYCIKGNGNNMNGMGCASKLLREPRYFDWLRNSVN